MSQSVVGVGGTMRAEVAGVLVLGVLLLWAGTATAQWNDDAQECWRPNETGSDPDRRIEICTRAIESGELSQKNLAATHNNRGGIYATMGDLDRAMADFNRSLELYPDYSNALISRGMAYGARHDYEKSLDDFTAAIRVVPTLARGYNGRCYTLALMGRAEEALEDCNRALQLEPNTPYMLDSRAYAYLRLGDYQRAHADYDLILQIEPESADAFYGRGIARLRLGRRAEGEQDLAAARKLDATVDRRMKDIGLVP